MAKSITAHKKKRGGRDGIFPPPIGRIQYSRDWAILGEAIYMTIDGIEEIPTIQRFYRRARDQLPGNPPWDLPAEFAGHRNCVTKLRT